MKNSSDSGQLWADAIAAYLRGGFEQPCGACLGFELEHFIVEQKTQAHVPYIHEGRNSGRVGVAAVLEQLASAYDKVIWENNSTGPHIIGLMRDKAVITLEPGAQIEVSIGPTTTVSETESIYQDFRAELDAILAEAGLELVAAGYHPSALASEIPLIPKDRYRYMDRHFASTGKHGICMMRASASCQVSVDYASEEDAVRKMRAALGLGPLLSFLTDTARVFEGESVFDAAVQPGLKARSGLSVPQGMVRTAIWDDVDAARSNLPPGVFADDFGFDAYAKGLLAAPAIFVPPTDPGQKPLWADGASFASILSGMEPTRELVEHVLSLFFYDARFKRYLEIRQADSMPAPYSLAYMALIKGVFYHDEALKEVVGRIAGIGEEDVAAAKAALAQEGYHAEVYGYSAAQWLEALQVLAVHCLPPEEVAYLEPFGDLIAERKTMLDVA